MRRSDLIIGVDFDNTIACYDRLFHRIAVERSLILPELPQAKNAVRDCLREAGKEDVWTEMQGEVYGSRMAEAELFSGVKEFFTCCKAESVPLYIVSHKTRFPFAGEPHDLHASARAWLVEREFIGDGDVGIPEENVFFELTKADKLERIAACRCSHFIDDLPEFLRERGFPSNVVRVLFDPNNRYAHVPLLRVCSWSELRNLIFQDVHD